MEGSLIIQKSVFELLKSNEIVVIPQFGAFVSDIESAKIQSFAVLPPSRKIIFNKNIIKDDGLLVKYVSEVLNQEYLKSKLIVAESVHGWKKSLTFGENINFDNIGKLSLNNEGHIAFETFSNKDLQSEFFGLETSNIRRLVKEDTKDFQPRIEPVNETLPKDKKIESLKKSLTTEKVPQKVIPLYKEKKTFKWGVQSAAAAVSPFIFLGLGLIGAKSIDKRGDLNFASMFSWVEEKVQQTSTSKVDITIPKIYAAEDFFSKEELELINEKIDDKSILRTDIDKSIKDKEEGEITNNIVEENQSVKSTSIKFKHHLVAGCFSVKANASKFLEELKSKGFNARLIGTTKNGLHRVAYGSYNSRKKALQQLASIKLNENKSCWILNEDI